MAVSDVAFGPDDSWVITYEKGTVCWSKGLPDSAHKFIKKNRNTNNLKSFAMGTNDDYFAVYEHGGYAYSIAYSPKINRASIEFATVGCDSSYIVSSTKYDYWNGVPARVQELLQTRNNSELEWASLGIDGSWFLMFSDGKMY